MRQTNNSGRRPRGRPNRKPQGNNRNQNFDSSGPDGRIRGGANQIYEKYLTLARDAGSAGDRIAAEAFYQHAEHYFRIMNESTDPESPNGLGQRSQQGERDINGRGPGDDRHRRPRDGDGATDTAPRPAAAAQVGAPSPAPVVAASTGAPIPAPLITPADAEIPGMEPQPAMPAEPAQSAVQEVPAARDADKPRRARPRKRPGAAAGPTAKPTSPVENSVAGSGASDKMPAERSAKKAGSVKGDVVEGQPEASAERAPIPPEGDGVAN